jgi:hypothetical protein
VVFRIRLTWDPAGGQRDPNAESVLKLWGRKYLNIEVEDLVARIERYDLSVADRGIRR